MNEPHDNIKIVVVPATNNPVIYVAESGKQGNVNLLIKM